MISIPLEDNFEDILGKAQRGLGLGEGALSKAAGITQDQWRAALEGKAGETVLRKLAGPLHLGEQALIDIANRAWKPGPIEVPGLFLVNTPLEGMTVNAFLVWDAAAKEAAAFDTGADCDGLLEKAAAEGVTIGQVLITHTHYDHIHDLDRLLEKTRARAFVCEREPLEGAESFVPGRAFGVGGLRIETRLTWGHARGGITYVISGLARPVAVVGDAIFAGSMGGGKLSYADALRTNREQILTLADETVLCPGHGPLTTVGEEKRHNPFFPEFQHN